LNAGSKGTFSASTSVKKDQYASYYYKTAWDDSNITEGVASRIKSSSSSSAARRSISYEEDYDNSNVFHYQSGREYRIERDRKIDKLRNEKLSLK